LEPLFVKELSLIAFENYTSQVAGLSFTCLAAEASNNQRFRVLTV
jgi:hypothetical protein